MPGSLIVGDWVEILSAEEILRTLDERGTMESLPFMPEMLPFIGRRFQVFKRATKTCDTISKQGFRRVNDTVMLEGLRCDGSSHGECQAGCLLFWKESWLRKVPAGTKVEFASAHAMGAGNQQDSAYHELAARVKRVVQVESGVEPTYMCLITEMKKASLPMAWWDIRHYWADVTCGNRTLKEVVRALLLDIFNWAQKKRGGVGFPYMEPGLLKKTPVVNLNLQPGDLVRIKKPDDIMKTLDGDGKTRGLRFDVGMFRYCDGEYRVVTRAYRLIDQKTGKMIHMTEQAPCIMLDGVLCHADYQKLCPRTEYLFWREAWLDKVS
ncbi:MAG: hypothetical protein HOO98_10680 [Nitrospira sp.]|nr:hypothetical protein [Nitrospira sp.]